MEARGVTFRLMTRLVDARPGVVVLSDGELRAETLVWTAGVAPSPLLATLPFARDKRGAVVVESTMAVPGQEGVWAVGDAAALTARGGGATRGGPPRAQHLPGAPRRPSRRSLPFRIPGRPLRRRPPDRVRGAVDSIRPREVRAVLRPPRVADVARHLPVEAPR